MHRKRFYVFDPSRLPAGVREGRAAYAAKRSRPKALSLFSGAMGLDLGLEQSGFEIAGCLECEPHACATIRANRPELPLIQDDIALWSGERILEECSLSAEGVSLITGGPPCPSFSTAGRRQSFNDPRGEVMFDFLRVVEEIRPPFFLMENVRGILSAAVRHRPLTKRGKGHKPLSPDERPGSVMAMLKRRFVEMGYTVTVELVNAADFGVPQCRERVIFLGSRDGLQVTVPVGTHCQGGSFFQQPWKTLADALRGLDDPDPEHANFSKDRLKYLKMLGEGENWRSLPKEILKDAMGGAYGASGGKVGFFRRLSFGKPSPTLPTSPVQKSTCLCHPTELRPLTVAEYAAIQQFPRDWQFQGPISAKYRQIGNAVPVGLGYFLGKAVLKYIECLEEVAIVLQPESMVPLSLPNGFSPLKMCSTMI